MDDGLARISHHPPMHAIRNVSSTTSPDALVQLTRFDLIFPWIETLRFSVTVHSLINNMCRRVFLF